LSDILVLDSEVLIYSTSTTGYGGILIINDFEVLILVYLCEGNTSIAGVDNPSIKLEIIIKGKTLAFLGQKPGLLQSQLLLFSEGIIFDKECIISLKADNTKGLITIKETGIID
jgi:hypothetical protein